MSAAARRAYGLSEFAEMAGLSPSTVKSRMDAGDIPELAPIGSRRFIPATWVEEWAARVIDRRASQPTATT